MAKLSVIRLWVSLPSIFAVVQNPYNVFSCEEQCNNDPTCKFYSNSVTGFNPPRCNTVNSHPHESVSKVPAIEHGFGTFSPRTCSDAICYPNSKSCVMCASKPTDWLKYVGPNYKVYVSETCCDITMKTTEAANVQFSLTQPLVLPYSSIEIIGSPLLTVTSTVCPLFKLNNSISSVIIQNLSVQCPYPSPTGIFVQTTPKINVTLTNVYVANAKSAISVIGGNPSGVPPYSSTDISGSTFHNVAIKRSVSSGTAAVALAMTTGTNIDMSYFDPNQLVVIQPFEGAISKFSTISNPPRLFNVTQFTNIFGTLYELQYNNMEFGTMDELSRALQQVAFTQILVFVALLLGLFILHSDIFYYITLKKKIE